MGDEPLQCSLCCDKTFNNKHLLVEHLSDVLDNLSCPICNSKVSSLAYLIEHLNFNKCQSENIENNEVLVDETSAENLNCLQTHIENINQKEEPQDAFSPDSDKVDSEDNSEVGKMYVELLSKQLMKPCLQTQELKLVKEHGGNRYIIMASDETDLRTENTTIVTKQNSDGTISLTDVKDMKLSADPLVAQMENESEDNEEMQQQYSCNTCGVTFSSVVEHIQNYHNDQDVVVEESIEDSMSNDKNIPTEYEQVANEDSLNDKLSLRRVITDTGDIVETALFNKNDSVVESEVSLNVAQPINEEVVDKLGRVYTRRYVQIHKFCDSIVRDINKSDEKKGPFHKVIVKEMKTIDNGNKVKVYNCLLCGVYVPSLDDFKTIPCKIVSYKCPHCTVAYDNPKSLCAHMKVHKMTSDDNIKVPGPFKCEICSTIFPTNKSLKLHKRMHDPIKSRPIEPPVETSDVNNDKFLCSICDKLIPIDYRIIHQNSHNTDNKYNCDICNRKFHSNEYLEMHMSVHSNDKVPVNKQDKSLPYNCLYCSRQFARPHEKVKHERIHTGEKPHSCEICGKSFRVSYCLTLHMRTHTGARPYACHHCGKRFKAHSVYNHHLLTHSEVRAYKCPYCPKAFKTSVQLAGHKNSHTKPFSCQHCNRPFASLYAVRVHTETHARQNNLKFSCSLCGASYARTFALRDHIRQVHKQDLNTAETMAFKQKDWEIDNGDTDAENMQTLDKSLPQEINELAMTSNEPESVMIVP